VYFYKEKQVTDYSIRPKENKAHRAQKNIIIIQNYLQLSSKKKCY